MWEPTRRKKDQSRVPGRFLGASNVNLSDSASPSYRPQSKINTHGKALLDSSIVRDVKGITADHHSQPSDGGDDKGSSSSGPSSSLLTARLLKHRGNQEFEHGQSMGHAKVEFGDSSSNKKCTSVISGNGSGGSGGDNDGDGSDNAWCPSDSWGAKFTVPPAQVRNALASAVSSPIANKKIKFPLEGKALSQGSIASSEHHPLKPAPQPIKHHRQSFEHGQELNATTLNHLRPSESPAPPKSWPARSYPHGQNLGAANTVATNEGLTANGPLHTQDVRAARGSYNDKPFARHLGMMAGGERPSLPVSRHKQKQQQDRRFVFKHGQGMGCYSNPPPPPFGSNKEYANNKAKAMNNDDSDGGGVEVKKQQPRSPAEFLALAAASRKQRMGDSNIHWHKSSKTNKTSKQSSSSSSSLMMKTTSEPLHPQTDLGRLTTGGHNLANATLRTAMRSFGYSHLKQSQAGIEAVNPPELDPHGWAMRSQKFTRPKERAYPHGQALGVSSLQGSSLGGMVHEGQLDHERVQALMGGGGGGNGDHHHVQTAGKNTMVSPPASPIVVTSPILRQLQIQEQQENCSSANSNLGDMDQGFDGGGGGGGGGCDENDGDLPPPPLPPRPSSGDNKKALWCLSSSAAAAERANVKRAQAKGNHAKEAARAAAFGGGKANSSKNNQEADQVKQFLSFSQVALGVHQVSKLVRKGDKVHGARAKQQSYPHRQKIGHSNIKIG